MLRFSRRTAARQLFLEMMVSQEALGPSVKIGFAITQDPESNGTHVPFTDLPVESKVSETMFSRRVVIAILTLG